MSIRPGNNYNRLAPWYGCDNMETGRQIYTGCNKTVEPPHVRSTEHMEDQERIWDSGVFATLLPGCGSVLISKRFFSTFNLRLIAAALGRHVKVIVTA